MEHNNAIGPNASTGDMATRSTWRGRLVIMVAIMVAGLWAATQFLAHKYGYHPGLGANIQHVYAPWMILRWPSLLGPQHHQAIMQAGGFGILITTGLMLIASVAMMYNTRRSRPNTYLHGSARWANMKDIQQAGLLSEADDSVFVGAYEDPKKGTIYLRHSGPEHVLCAAPTRSGKGVGLIVPTLLTWTHSVFVTDLKGELWELTSGWRRDYAGQKVIRFEPAVVGSAGWNPLDEVRRTLQPDGEVLFDVGDAQNIAFLMIDQDGKGLHDHWTKGSHALITGLILHALYMEHHQGRPASIPAIDRLLSDPNREIDLLWREMLEFPHYQGKPLDIIAQSARDQMDREGEEASSMLSTAKTYFSLYRDPVIAANVGRCDFRIRDLMHHKTPVSLYVVTSPRDNDRLRPLIRLLVDMTVRTLTANIQFENGRQKKSYDHRLLLMLDEFPALKKVPILQESLAFLAGYGIKAYIIIQDFQQLRARDAYGPEETITANCHVMCAYAPINQETAKALSARTGKTTVIRHKFSISGKRSAFALGNVSETYDEVGRPLLTEDEVLQIPAPEKDGDRIIKAGDMLVFAAGRPTIYGRQPLFFFDPALNARASVPAPKASDTLYPILNAVASRV